MRRRPLAVLLGGLALGTVVTAASAGATAPADERTAANPSPVVPAVEPLINEGVTVEGPLINNFTLPEVLKS